MQIINIDTLPDTAQLTIAELETSQAKGRLKNTFRRPKIFDLYIGQSMTPQEQKNRLNDIMFHAQRCELYDDEHRLCQKTQKWR